MWIGAGISEVERLALASFVAHGHVVHLYLYDDIPGIPGGVVVRDAKNAIIAEEEIFTNRSGSLGVVTK